MSKEDLVFPVEPVVRVKDPSALEFSEVPRAHTEGVKHDLVFPEGEEAREAKIVEGEEAREAKIVEGEEASEAKSIQGKEPKSHTPVASPRSGIRVSRSDGRCGGCLGRVGGCGCASVRRPFTACSGG